MSKVLYLRSDDAGLSPGTNQAIDEVSGVVPNIGLMAPTPAIEDAIERFRGRKDVCLGLHFTLNSEWVSLRWGPISPRDRVPNLVLPDGTLRPTPWVLPEGFAYDPAEVEIEMQAQLDFLRARGVDVRYLDAHMVVFQTKPELNDMAVRFCEREGLALGDAFSKLRPGPCEGSIEKDLARWDGVLDAAPETSLAFFHPALADGVMETLGEPGKPSPLPTRIAEHALLRDPRFAALLAAKNVRVGRFDERT